jgi:hypothetical protein
LCKTIQRRNALLEHRQRSKKAKNLKKPPLVDDADVARMIHFMFGKSLNTALTPEERAATAYQVALGITTIQKRSKAYAEAFAQKVRAKALWITTPTGVSEEMPD